MRKALVLLIALVIGGVGALVLLSYVRSAEERAFADAETVEVLVAGAAIPKGTPASEIIDVHTQRVPVGVRAADAVDSLASLDGKVAEIDLVPGEQLVASRFVEPAELARTSQVEVPEGKQLVTVSLSPTRTLGGELRPGDHVGVWVSLERSDSGTDEGGEDGEEDSAEVAGAPPSDLTTHLVLHKALVTNVQGEPQPTPDEEEIDPATGRPAAPADSLFVTLALDTREAGKLIFAAEYGLLWMTLQPDHATDEGRQVETMETIYQ